MKLPLPNLKVTDQSFSCRRSLWHWVPLTSLISKDFVSYLMIGTIFQLFHTHCLTNTVKKKLKVFKSIHLVTKDRRLGITQEFFLFHLHPNKCRVQVVLLLKYFLEFSFDPATLVLTHSPHSLTWIAAVVSSYPTTQLHVAPLLTSYDCAASPIR